MKKPLTSKYIHLFTISTFLIVGAIVELFIQYPQLGPQVSNIVGYVVMGVAIGFVCLIVYAIVYSMLSGIFGVSSDDDEEEKPSVTYMGGDIPQSLKPMPPPLRKK